MTAIVIDGKAVAAAERARTSERARAFAARHGRPPGLAVVQVGEDPASTVYVRNKRRSCAEVAIESFAHDLPASTREAELLELIGALNRDPRVDGILVQMPLPKGIDSNRIIDAIDPAKDVDGLNPVNAGLLQSGRTGLVPCTPAGVMKLLAETGVAVRGARALVLGRSVLVGRPLAALLTNADATVTTAHSRTRDLPAECRRAEVLVAAAGRAEMVRGDWIAPGAVVIDVGINRLGDGRLVGDVAYAEAAPHARAITPVPGGVGPMTIACLLENTVIAARRRRGG